VEDITERKKFEQSLYESEAQKKAILNGISTNIAFVDLNLKIIWANQTAAKSANRTIDEMVGLHCYQIWATPHKFCDNCPSHKAITSKKKEHILINTPDGRVWDESGEPIFDENGNLIGIVEIAQDITDRVRAEQILKDSEKQLRELNETKDKFFAILAHDLRSPFNSILGFSELLIKNIRNYDIDKIESYVTIINQMSVKTFNLLEEILLWAKSQAGKLPFEPEKMNFAEICNDVIFSLKENAELKQISITCLNTRQIYLEADYNMLNTILRNLISNAIKFTNTGGRINVSCEIIDNKAIITVSDNGVGIDATDYSKLWEISSSRTKIGTANEKGSGFGLILCKEFIEKHGGKIWVESEVGKGSDFKFTLPLCNATSNNIN